MLKTKLKYDLKNQKVKRCLLFLRKSYYYSFSHRVQLSKQCPAEADIMDFLFSIKKWQFLKASSNEYSYSLGSIIFVASKKKLLLIFPLVPVLNCGGPYLWFPIHVKYAIFARDHSCTVWVQSCLLFLRKGYY